MANLTVETMKWLKKGLLYCPDGSAPWAQQYACLPTPMLIDSQRLRIFLAFCDQKMIGRVGYVDVDPDNPENILTISPQPILDIGKPGRFDENGVVPTSILPVADKLFMYYVGYQIGQKIRYYQFGGLAVSVDGGNSFQRAQEVPVIDRSHEESLNRTAAFVMLENQRFRMWYVAGSEWTTVNGKTFPTYNVRYLESSDGIQWPTCGKICLNFESEDEYVIGRPWVVKTAGIYKMFLSSRTKSNGYRLGYAESKDGISWRRLDNMIDIDVSSSGWDSQMIAYASIFNWKEKTYMFYNGNDCGRSGFGYALLGH
jgi:predicted GH43/DUF377 family glycosyl hydrolase